MLVMDFLEITFIMIWYVPCISNLSRNFVMKKYWVLSKTFCASREMIEYFSFRLLYSGLHLLTFIHQIIPASMEWCLLDRGNFDVFLDCVCKCFIQYFFIYDHKGNQSVILYHCCVFIVVWVSGQLWAHKTNLAVFLLFLFCWITWGKLMLTLWKYGGILH